MKPVHKSYPGPEPLLAYLRRKEQASWDQFKTDERQAYGATCARLEQDQGGLCAYCEIAIAKREATLQVEHLVAKSCIDQSINWGLHWPNMIAVCPGGSQYSRDEHRYIDDLPLNLSCDQHKNHLVNLNKIPADSRGWIASPLEVPSLPRLVDVLHDGKLKANPEACSEVVIHPNHYATTEELITKTIENLNLNCYRLCNARVSAHRQVIREINSIPPAERGRLCPKFLSKRAGRYRQFFTVFRCRLGQAAESFLLSADP